MDAAAYLNDVQCPRRGSWSLLSVGRSLGMSDRVVGDPDQSLPLPIGTAELDARAIMVARAGDNLSWVWFRAPQGDVIMAFGRLARKTGR